MTGLEQLSSAERLARERPQDEAGSEKARVGAKRQDVDERRPQSPPFGTKIIKGPAVFGWSFFI